MANFGLFSREKNLNFPIIIEPRIGVTIARAISDAIK